MRIVAIDFGKKRIGIAMTDNQKIMALPYKTLDAANSLKESAILLQKEFAKMEIEKIIIGNPLFLNGDKSPMSLIVEKFKEELMTLLLVPVELFDERLSSKGADALLREAGYNRKKRAELSDSSAALILLQTYLAC